jgi:hypothetical protein
MYNDLENSYYDDRSSLLYESPLMEEPPTRNKKGGKLFEYNNAGGAEDSKTIIFEHDFQKKILSEALDTVKQFIITKKRILTGGMAIDMALRNKGGKLYEDNEVPDYDFFSPEFHIDAYNLGIELSKKFSGVSVIRALHVSTMKVRINFAVVADISYMPTAVYDKIPTLMYKGFRIVHPHYQMIDQHISLSRPFENPPMETVMARWKKDIQRYDMLVDNYPLDVIELKEFTDDVQYEISIDTLKDHCVNGYVAALYWIKKAESDGYDLSRKNLSDIVGTFNMESILTVEMPGDVPFTIYTDDFNKICGDLKITEKKYYSPFLDKLPRHIEGKVDDHTYEIFDNRGKLISAHFDQCWFSNIQTVMCYLLTKYIMDNLERHLFLYLELQSILFWAANKYGSDGKYDKYLPTVEVYGRYNWSESYMISLEDILVLFKFMDRKTITPKNLYPEPGKPLNESVFEFNPEETHIYKFDGAECDTFEELMLPDGDGVEADTDDDE